MARGEHYLEQVVLWEDYLAWFVTGMVRTALADLAEAEAILAGENTVLADTQELIRVTLRLQEAGEVAMLDVMQARNRVLDQLACT